MFGIKSYICPETKLNMSQKNNTNSIATVCFLIILAAITRFIPHPFNFTAVGAMALFSGANFKDKRFAYLMPIAVMFLTDLYFGFHFSILPVYACFAFTVWLGTRISQNQNPKSIGLNSITSSVIFFLITNLPFWYLDQGLYSMDLRGTMQSYTMALPFFTNQIIGDLFYNGLLFSLYYVIAIKSRKEIA